MVCVLGLASDSFVQSSLVQFYLKCDSIVDARLLFDRMTDRNVVSWSIIITGYARRGCVDEALLLLHRMQSSGIEPNLITWNGLISGFNSKNYALEAVLVLKRMWTDGFLPDKITVSSVLSAIGDLEDVTAGTQIHGYAIKQGLESYTGVTSASIDMYGKCHHTSEMIRVFQEMKNSGNILDDVACCNALISGLSRNNQIDRSLEIFRELNQRGDKVNLNVISWTSIISSCVQNGKDVEALELFVEMQASGFKPNKITIPCLLPACSNIAILNYGKSIHCFALRGGISDDVYVGSALVDTYAKCGKIKYARMLFDFMPERNVVSWNAMFGGYAMHGKTMSSIKLFDLMQTKSDHKPDFITFSCLLSACSQTGHTEEGLFYFDSMRLDYGITARTEHYACMVSLLGRVGKLEEAHNIIKDMPIEADGCVWGALLSSCKARGDVKLAEIAAEKLFEIEPRHVGNYILLSNIYAAKGMHDRVDGVRERMKRLGLRKNAGCSWIEVKKKVHVLLAGDDAHPQMSMITMRLEHLSLDMKKIGYVPRTGVVLQDVEEQEKEHILCGHSEKLALGVGLLNTESGSCLRIIKNLRICGDCHSFIKFASMFEGREILVRDTNRFHRFKNGVCSCTDYW